MNISVILATFSPLQLAYRSFLMLQPWGMLVLDGVRAKSLTHLYHCFSSGPQSAAPSVFQLLQRGDSGLQLDV